MHRFLGLLLTGIIVLSALSTGCDDKKAKIPEKTMSLPGSPVPAGSNEGKKPSSIE